MKLGFGLYRHMLDREHLQFARQCGATHVVVHMVDYFNQAGGRSDQPVAGGRGGGWGQAGDPDKPWTLEELLDIKALVESEGLELYAIENFDPAHWFDILLDGPKKQAQLAGVCGMIRAVGAAGIPVIGYNFSLAGVYGRVQGNWARGGAGGVGMAGLVDQEPMPDGMVWNMTFDESARGTSIRTQVSSDELWERLKDFLQGVLPVAEKAGVRMAAHPDDPPVPRLRNTPRLVYQADLYQKLIDLVPSNSNQLEFCLGTLAEMPGCDVLKATRHYAQQGKIAYVHFRNVRGYAPDYQEVFIDEGDIELPAVIRILHQSRFDGVLIPDHAPQMACRAPWHAGMAYSMGYMKALIEQCR